MKDKAKACSISIRNKLSKLTILFGGFFTLLFYANMAFAAGGTGTATKSAESMMHALSGFAGIIGAISVIIGIALFLGGFFRLKLYGQMRGTYAAHQVTIAGSLVMFLSGVLMMVLPTVLRSSLLAFWGTANPMAYSGANTTPWSVYIPVVIMFVRLVGVAAFIRGILLLSRTGQQGSQQPGVLSKALLHMLGGILCINIVATHALLKSLLPI